MTKYYDFVIHFVCHFIFTGSLQRTFVISKFVLFEIDKIPKVHTKNSMQNSGKGMGEVVDFYQGFITSRSK